MARLFYMIGKSSTGKDTIYREVISRSDLNLNPLVMYTTRPIREGETDGKDYHFVDENVLKELEKEDKNRADYYQYYTGRQWGYAGNYDLCVNTFFYGHDETIQVLYDMAELSCKKN